MRIITPVLLLMSLVGCAQLPLVRIGPLTPLDVAATFCLDQAWEVEQQVEVGGTILHDGRGGLECSVLTIGQRNSVSIPIFAELATFHTHLHRHSSQLSWIDRRSILEDFLRRPGYVRASSGRITVYECPDPVPGERLRCQTRRIR